MGKPRRKGMRRGYLKRFSAQAINAGMYAPHRPTMAEMKRRPQSLGNINHRSLAVTQPQPLPPTKGATINVRHRVKRWELFQHNERHQVKLEEVHVAKEYETQKSLYRLCFVSNRGWWFWFHKDKPSEVMRRSIIYSSAQRAMAVFVDNIVWEGPRSEDS